MTRIAGLDIEKTKDGKWQIRIWGPWPLGRRSFIRKLLIGPPRFCLLVLAILGASSLVKRGRLPDALLLAGPMVVISLAYVMAFSVARFTHTMEPIGIVLSAYAVLALVGRTASARSALPARAGEARVSRAGTAPATDRTGYPSPRDASRDDLTRVGSGP